RGCAVCTPRIPKGRPLPCTRTLRLDTTPCAARSGALPNRASVARSSTTTGPVERSTYPACESASVGNTVRPTAPSRQPTPARSSNVRSEEHTSELQSRFDLVCRLLLEIKKESRCHLHETSPSL